MERVTPTSPSSEKDDFYRSLVSRCASTIVATLGEGSLEAILMIGAPARSEATVVETAEGLYSLSDIDLICVLPPSKEPSALARALGARVLRLNDELADACSGVDASLKTRGDLAVPQPLISNYEMLRSPVVVWGDESIVAGLPEPDIDRIPAHESLTLFHNRIVEEVLLYPEVRRADNDPWTSLSILYRTAKLALDTVTAVLFLRGAVPEGYRERVAAFLGHLEDSPELAPLGAALEDSPGELGVWADFKAGGELDALVDRLGGSRASDDLARVARDAWYRHVEFAAAAWRAILGNVLGRNLLDADLATVVRAYGRLETPARSAARAIKALRSDAGLLSRRRVLGRCAFASPRLLAYVTAVLTYLGTRDTADQAWIDSAILSYCPFELPTDAASLDREALRDAIIERLARYHESVLLGRATGGDR